jgi:hypothetical protein
LDAKRGRSWKRFDKLLAVTPKYIESEINSARSSVDFFVALFYLSIFFGFACLVLGSIEHFKISILLLSVPAFLLAILCHWFAIRAIDAWSYPSRALVNLGRVKLADSLGLRLPKTLKEEKTMWGLVAEHAANREDGEALDAYRKTTVQLSDFLSRLETLQRYVLANSICEGLPEGDERNKARAELIREIAMTTRGASDQSGSGL